MKVVLIQPFHNDDEKKARTVIENDLESLGITNISSKVEIGTLPTNEILELELDTFKEADTILVNIDNKLSGVMIMFGSAFTINSTIRKDNPASIITYSLSGYGTNPFFQAMSDHHFSSYEELLIHLSSN